jgi:hypothetical protein
MQQISISQDDDLTDAKFSGSDDCCINACKVVVHVDDGLHDLGVCFGCFGIEIDHHTTQISHGDADRRARPIRAKFQDLAHPSIFLERMSVDGIDHEIRPETAEIEFSAYSAPNAPYRPQRDRGNCGVVEDSVFELHEINISPVTSCNIFSQRFVRKPIFFSVGRSDVRRQWLPCPTLSAERLIEKQFGKPARRQPGEGAAIGEPSKREPPVAFDAMPTKFCSVELFTGHRFDWIAKESADVTELNSHGLILKCRDDGSGSTNRYCTSDRILSAMSGSNSGD